MKLHLYILSLIFTFICSGCTQKQQLSASDIDEDYVLVEFASKLEEDFHRINDQPTVINENNDGIHP